MNVIQNILQTIERVTKVKPVAFSSKTIQSLPCISYQAFRQADTGTIESWRLQLRFTAETLQETIRLEGIVADELVSIGDNGSNGALEIQVNGGGTLEDETTGLPQLITYYDIQSKSYVRGTNNGQ